jgi:hypothetical protein
MDQLTSKEARLKEIVVVAEETVRLIKQMVEELEGQIVEWKRLAESKDPQR